VALGRALAIDPEMLLLDEPLSNLDARTRLSLRHEIRAIQMRLGITALHVTHDREEAMVMADRIVVMRDGQIEQEGPPERVYNQPATPFVASFMGADNVVRLSAQATPDGVSLRLEPDGMPAGILPRGTGAHPGAFAAHFRMTSARLLPQGQDAPEAGLHMPGRVLQASYPGGMWRHTVAVGDRRFLIDDTSGHPAGAAVGVFVPAALLHLFPAPA
jgi:ABC-type Fe3+/spermidine/putrescine transport system ATPase subunit